MTEVVLPPFKVSTNECIDCEFGNATLKFRVTTHEIEPIGQDKDDRICRGDVVSAQQKGGVPRSPWVAAIIRTLTWQEFERLRKCQYNPAPLLRHELYLIV
jgi:hypothetical protein